MTQATATSDDPRRLDLGPAPTDARHFTSPLHLLLLDEEGKVRASNHPVIRPDDCTLPDMIRAAYGVTEHANMPQMIYERMETRLGGYACTAGYYLCETDSGQPFWLAVSFYNTSKGRAVCHHQISHPKLDQFQEFFAHFKRAEAQDAGPLVLMTPADTSALQKRVADYRTLATTIMIESIGRREGAQIHQQYRSLLVLTPILKALQVIAECGQKIAAMSGRSKLIPFQLKLQAARLEGGKGPFSVIAENHQHLTNDLLHVTRDLQASSTTEIDAVTDAIAFLSQSFTIAEFFESQRRKGADAADPMADETDELNEVIEDCALQVRNVLSDIDRSVAMLSGIGLRMRRALSALEMTRMMCKIERANLTEDVEGLRDIEDQLRHVESSLFHLMGKIDDNAKTALSLVAHMNRGARAAA